MNSTNEIISRKDGAMLRVLLNSGPVVETATISLYLESVSNYKPGSRIEIIVPEEEILTFLKKQKQYDIKLGQTKKLILSEPKTFVLYVRPNTSGNTCSYVLDKDASISVKIPYSILQKIHLVVEVDQIKFDVPIPADSRSSVQICPEKLKRIFIIE